MTSSDGSVAPVRIVKRCLHCNKTNVKNRCGGCRAVYFCDRDCQMLAWLRHRPHCHRQLVADSLPSASREDNNKAATPAKANAVTQNSSGESTTSNESKMERIDSSTTPPETPLRQQTQAPERLQEPLVIRQLACREEELQQQETTPQQPASSSSSASKRNKKKKLKKKKRSSSYHGESSAGPTGNSTALHQKNRSASLPSAKKQITWGEIEAREFARFPGGGGTVPYDGTWALGLGQPLRDVQLGTVAEFEEQRAEELKQRAKQLSKSERPFVRDGETRQFDYCRGVHNPLFSRLSERERKHLFIENQSVSHPEVTMRSKHHGKHHEHQQKQVHQTPVEDDDQHEDFACVSIEQLDEFAKIRDSRDACGCSCGDLVRKVTKMNVKKLHHFLAERNVQITVHSKPELLALAKAIARDEKNCSNSSECECLQNGIACHQLVCSGCAKSCANPLSSYTYNREEITKYRKSKLMEWRTRGPPSFPVTA